MWLISLSLNVTIVEGTTYYIPIQGRNENEILENNYLVKANPH